jgi:hypothetical protein
MDHLVLLFWHALLVSVFFAFLWRKTGAGRRKLFLKTLVIMVVGGFVLGWLMFPFP